MLIFRRQINHFVAEQPPRRMRYALELNRMECLEGYSHAPPGESPRASVPHQVSVAAGLISARC